MTTKRLFTTICTLTMALGLAWAQGPNGSGTYYQNANGKSGQALKTALFYIIKIENAGWSYDGLKEAYKTTDTRSDTYLRDWYSNATSYVPGSNFSGGTSAEGQGYNREHLVPQSWFSEKPPMKSDIFHVVPTDAKINNARGSDPLGEVGPNYTSSQNGYSKWGKAKSGLGYTGNVFEPNKEVKGDIARAYFYMVTCYENKISDWTSSGSSGYVFDGNTYPGLTQWCLEMMIRWSAIDPVDEIEIARNNVIAKKQNRNPFIDYPGLEEYIWGSKTNVPFSYDDYNGSSTGKQYVTMSFSPNNVSVALGDEFTAPVLSISPSGLAVSYSSSNTSVATVDSQTGAVTIKAVGTTTITASFAGNDDYNAGSASYTLTVSKQGGDPTPSDGSFTKVTSAEQLVAGYEYIVVAENNNRVMSTSFGSTNKASFFNPMEAEISNQTIAYEDGMLVLTLGGNSGAYTFSNNGQYFVATDAKKVSLSNSSSTWTINTSNFTLTAGNSSYGVLRYNVNTPRFTTYTSTDNMENAVLYYRNPNASTTILGDIVKDGDVDMKDLKALVKILLGITPAGDNINLDAADVNEDGDTTIADVTKLVNLLLSK